MALCGVSVAAVSSPPSDRSSVSAVDASSPPPRLLVHHPSHLFSIRLPRSRACYQNFYIRFNDLPSLPPSLSLSLSLSFSLCVSACLCLSRPARRPTYFVLVCSILPSLGTRRPAGCSRLATALGAVSQLVSPNLRIIAILIARARAPMGVGANRGGSLLRRSKTGWNRYWRAGCERVLRGKRTIYRYIARLALV